MECAKKLKAALAAVPVSQPCTAEAVAALSARADDAAQQLEPVLFQSTVTVLQKSAVAEACGSLELPSACMPVLAWLAAGLRSGLPAAAHQQAYNVACVLLGVVSLVVPQSVKERLQKTGSVPRRAETDALGLLRSLGAIGEVSKQLALVASALVETAFPTSAATTTSNSNSISTTSSNRTTTTATITTTSTTSTTSTTTTATTTSSSSSSSKEATEAHKVAYLAMAWNGIGRLMTTVLGVQDEEVGPAVAAGLTGSGLYQVLLEGALLLLSVDPRAYSQAPDIQLKLSGSLRVTLRTAMTLTMTLSKLVLDAWYTATGTSREWFALPPQAISRSSNSSSAPWMQPLFRLQVLMLAKMQWDVRQAPGLASQPQGPAAWPAKPLAHARRHMVSPCVAGEVLQQRAPGLLPHVGETYTVVVNKCGQLLRREEADQPFDVISAAGFAPFLLAVCNPLSACLQKGLAHDTMGALDLALLLDVTELYCLASPLDWDNRVNEEAFYTLRHAVCVAPRSVLAEFSAARGEVLLSIAEYLVEDVLLVSSETAAAASGSAAGPQAADQGATSPAATGMSRQGTATTPHSSSSSDSNNSSNSKPRPKAGVKNRAVTLKHRLRWAQDAMATIGVLTDGQDDTWAAPSQTGGSPEMGDNVAGLMQSLFNPTNAPRVTRLLEVVLRTPELQGPRLPKLESLLPWRLPFLHAAASSPAGSRALLSAVTSFAKSQQVGMVILSAVVQTGGHLALAAAGVAAAVPGRAGQWVAQQMLQQPGMLVHTALEQGVLFTATATDLMIRAAALLDPDLAPLAAYLAAIQLPSGQDSKPWAVEAAVTSTEWLVGPSGKVFDYQGQMAKDPVHMEGIMQNLTAALSLQQAAAVRKQAATLVRKAGGGEAEAELLRQQLQGMWLGRVGDLPASLSTTEQQPLAAGGAADSASSASAGAASSSSGHPAAATGGAPRLPRILAELCLVGKLKLVEVLAAGDPAAWSSALGPTSTADLRVASTALLAACKAAGAVAQLPVLVGQVLRIMARWPWGRETVAHFDTARAMNACERTAHSGLLLAPLLAVLLPAQQAAELQAAAARVPRQTLTVRFGWEPATIAHVLGLLSHVVAPHAPGCSYPGCCNLEGRNEAELPVQVCTKCGGARYCCREHQVAHWTTGHKEVCRPARAAVKQVQRSMATGGP